LKYIGLNLDFKKSFKKKNPTNIGELQHMKYICDEIILVTKYEKLHVAKNPLRCTTQDKKGLILIVVLFYPIFYPHKKK
jgi:hypothetical protein